MKLQPLKIPGAYVIDINPNQDERGFFSRIFCFDQLKEQGIDFPVAQCSISFNREKNTLRGMHYQAAPYPELKIVRCTSGRIWDCIIDLRRESPAYKQWLGLELSADNRRSLLIPAFCAHGFITLTSDVEINYMMSAPYQPEGARGIRWDDPAIGIKWPVCPEVMNDKDRNFPDFISQDAV